MLHACRMFAKNFSNIDTSIALLGSVGTGKTHLSCAIASAILTQFRSVRLYDVKVLKLNNPPTYSDYRIRYVRCSSLFRHIHHATCDKTSNAVDILSDYAMVDLLVLDECGPHELSCFQKDILDEIIDRRYSERKKTVFCSNLDVSGFSDFMGPRCFDRFCEDGEILPMQWGSYRTRSHTES